MKNAIEFYIQFKLAHKAFKLVTPDIFNKAGVASLKTICESFDQSVPLSAKKIPDVLSKAANKSLEMI
jgi:hypothetical protein